VIYFQPVVYLQPSVYSRLVLTNPSSPLLRHCNVPPPAPTLTANDDRVRAIVTSNATTLQKLVRLQMITRNMQETLRLLGQ